MRSLRESGEKIENMALENFCEVTARNLKVVGLIIACKAPESIGQMEVRRQKPCDGQTELEWTGSTEGRMRTISI